MPTARPRPTGLSAVALLMIPAMAGLARPAAGQIAPDRCVVPPEIRDPILQEYSGEQAYLHVQMLAANRVRPVEEYSGTFFETGYLREHADRYGLDQVSVEYFPAGEIWVPEEAGLWLTAPFLEKIADLHMVPAALASGSRSADVEAEVVYVGAGRREDYEGLDLTGKIVLGSGSVGSVFGAAVGTHGAAGALGTGYSGTGGDYPGLSLDAIGWQSVRATDEADGFGFVLSRRQFDEIRQLIEYGVPVRMRAHVKTRSVPYRMNVVSAAIEGTDPDAGDLIFVSHAFERIATPGANDNCSGVATTLEIARTLSRLIDTAVLPRPLRTIRFLWVPEISGSRAWMYEHAELEERLLAAMNYDMPGEDLEKTDSYLRMKMTPDSRASYLNDLIGSLLRFVDQTDIRTQQGNNAPFNYRMVPFISASDHVVFMDAGVPAMQFNHWTDNFYHSSEDRIVHSDPTEMKRTGFMGAAAFYYLATAGADEARVLAWEAAANGERWVAEVTRQSLLLLDADASAIHDRHKAVRTKVEGAFGRASGAVRSVLDLADDPEVRTLVDGLTASLSAARDGQIAKVEMVYRDRCAALGVQPQPVTLNERERELDGMVPRKRFRFYTPEYRDASRRVNQLVPRGVRLPGLAGTEVDWFIDGERSILDIYRAVRAEYGNVTTSNTEWKFAYVVTPDSPDIDLEAVAAIIEAMEQAGLVEIVRR